MAHLIAGKYRILVSLLTVGRYLQTYRGGEHVSDTSYAPAGQTPNRAGHRPAFRVQHDPGPHQQGAAPLFASFP
jgi:hypothetical protein